MSVEKNQLLKVGDRVKILPTILADYPDFPYEEQQVEYVP